MIRFLNRADAGRRLASHLTHLVRDHPLVLAVPRGGVPVAAEVAAELALPLDVLVVRKDICDADLNHRIEAGEPYFHDLRSRWSAALRAAHQNIPRPPYKSETEAKN